LRPLPYHPEMACRSVSNWKKQTIPFKTESQRSSENQDSIIMQLPTLWWKALEQETAFLFTIRTQNCRWTNFRVLSKWQRLVSPVRPTICSHGLFDCEDAGYVCCHIARDARMLATLEGLVSAFARWYWGGPGTGGWAAAELFPSLQSIDCVEASLPMAKIGQRLAHQSPWATLQQAQWHQPSDLPAADLALLSYLIAEMTLAQRTELLEKIWTKTQVIVVVEPGTPAGYQTDIRSTRLGAQSRRALDCSLSPFPAMSFTNAWLVSFSCSRRTNATASIIEGGLLGYEDEKFCYLGVWKTGCAPTH
jgi:hypothetical protein